MATPVILGVGAIAAAFAGRHFIRRAGKGVAEEFVKGGFKTKMDRKEAIQILGLKYGCPLIQASLVDWICLQGWSFTEDQAQGRASANHARKPPGPWRFTIPRK